MEDDPMDRPGDDGFDAPVVGGRGEFAPGSSSGRCAAPDGQKLLSTPGCGFGADRRLGGVPREHSASVPRKGQRGGGSGAAPAASLARDRGWDGDQKDSGKERR